MNNTMRPMVYQDAVFPPTLEQMRRVECNAGSILPDDAKRYLISIPGRWPSRDNLRIGNTVFTGFRIGGYWRNPENMLIHTGDSVCLFIAGANRKALFGIELSDNDYGAMYLCEKERGTPGRRLERVADNLFALLDMLEEDPKTDFWEFYKKCRNLDGPDWVHQTYRDFEEYSPTDEERLQFSNPERLLDIPLTDSGPGVSQEYLDWVELAFRIRLPLDLRKFYSLHNGGRPVTRLIESDGYPVDVKFCSWERPTSNDMPRWTEGEFAEYVKGSKYGTRLLPAHMWPLGYTGLSNQCLSFSTEKGQFGSIWLGGDSPEKRPVKIADSFSQFVSSVWNREV